VSLRRGDTRASPHKYNTAALIATTAASHSSRLAHAQEREKKIIFGFGYHQEEKRGRKM
jgi:hypothetical protein